jgi:AcrR family transcriptional regulator
MMKLTFLHDGQSCTPGNFIHTLDRVTPKAGIREAKKHETRRALGLAAFQLAVEHGLHGFRVEDVTDRAGVSRRTFFNYFNRKEEAIVAVCGFVFDDGLAELGRRPADEPLMESLRAVAALVVSPEQLSILVTLGQLSEQHHELRPYALSIREHMVSVAHDALAARVAPAQRATFFPFALVHAVFAVIGAALEYSGRGEQERVDVLIDEAFDYLRTGFSPTG